MALISITKKDRNRIRKVRVENVKKDLIEIINQKLENGERDFIIEKEYNFRVERKSVKKELLDSYKSSGWKNIEIIDKTVFVYKPKFEFKF